MAYPWEQGYQPPAPDPRRRAVTRQNMPVSTEVFHWTMIVCTMGLWTPVYLAARRKRTSVTRYEV